MQLAQTAPLVAIATVCGRGISPKLSTTPWNSCTSTSSGVSGPSCTRAFTASSDPTRGVSEPASGSTDSTRTWFQPWFSFFRQPAKAPAALRLSAVRAR